MGMSGASDRIRKPGRQPIEPTGVPNIPALTSRQGLRNSSGSLAIFAAIRRACYLSLSISRRIADNPSRMASAKTGALLVSLWIV